MPIPNGTSGLSQGPFGTGVDVKVDIGDGIAVGVEVFVLVAGGLGKELTPALQAVSKNINNINKRNNIFFMSSSSPKTS